MPVRRELPVPRRERVHLERLRQLIDVELHAHRRFVLHAFRHVARGGDWTGGDMADESLDVVERFERLPERPARHAVLARQRAVRHAIGDRPRRHIVGKPQEARALQLEVDREVERNALVERLLERGRQVDVELRGEQDFVVVDAQRSRRHRNVGSARSVHARDEREHRDDDADEAASCQRRRVGAENGRHAGEADPHARAGRMGRVARGPHQRLRSSA
jgi:hypothetical protein